MISVRICSIYPHLPLAFGMASYSVRDFRQSKHQISPLANVTRLHDNIYLTGFRESVYNSGNDKAKGKQTCFFMYFLSFFFLAYMHLQSVISFSIHENMCPIFLFFSILLV